MGVLGSIVQIPRPAVLYRRHDLAVRDLVAAQPVGDDDPLQVLQALEGHRQLNWGPAESRREDRVRGSGVAPFRLRRTDR